MGALEQLFAPVVEAVAALEVALVNAGLPLGTVVSPPTAIAFVAGAVAVITGARLAILAAAAFAAGWLAQRYDLLPQTEWLLPLVLVLFALGLFQAAVTIVAGKEAAGDALGILILGVVVYLLWRAPAGLISKLLGRR